MAKGVIESPRPSYGRSKLTLIVCIAEVGNFLFNQFHSHLLPNVFAFWQFSRILEIFRDSGKLPKCKVIQQKIAVELIKLCFFFRKFDFLWVYPEKFNIDLLSQLFFPDTDMYTYRKSSKNYGPKTNEKFFTRNPNSRYERIVKSL